MKLGFFEKVAEKLKRELIRVQCRRTFLIIKNWNKFQKQGQFFSHITNESLKLDACAQKSKRDIHELCTFIPLG